MKKIVLGLLVLGMLGGAGIYYFKFGGSPETRRERALGKARDYMKQSKVNEALIEFQNALKADPRSAEARFEFGEALLQKGDGRAGFREFRRAVDLKPGWIKAR